MLVGKLEGGEGGEHTLEAWRVRWRTVMVWSWAVTSLRVLGRLEGDEGQYLGS